MFKPILLVKILWFLPLLNPLILQAQRSQVAPATTGLGFGGAVAVDDQNVFVGSAAIGWPRGDEPAGTVYHYSRNELGEWVETNRLQASDGGVGDFFGRSIFLNNATLLIGAPGISTVYIFEKNDSGAWRETGKVMPSDLGERMDFGGTYARGGYRTNTIAMAGDRIVVSAYPKVDLDLRSGPRALNEAGGKVYVFGKEEASWKLEATLTQVETAEDGFGFAIAASDDQILVSAPGAVEGAGALYVFTLDAASSTWKREAVSFGEELAPRSAFGLDIAINDRELYVSAPGFYRSGAVFVFKQDSEDGSWEYLKRLSLPEVSPRMGMRGGMGTRLAVSGRTLLVNGPDNTVYTYRKREEDDSWGSLHFLRPEDDRIRRSFGVGLAVHERVAVVGSPSADYEEGIATVFENDGQYGPWQPAATLVSEVNAIASVRGGKVACEEGAAGLFDCNKVDLISFVSLKELSPNRGAKMTDIWGWEDPQTGVEYVLQGREDGVAFVDIRDPYNPVYVGQLMKTEGSPGSSWRDIKVYKDHAFIVSDGAGQHGMQVFDLTQLRDIEPANMPVDFEETVHYDGIASSHNIVINEETGFAYAVGNDSGGEACGGQLHMIDIQNPKKPAFAGCYTYESGRGTHDAQCVTYRGPDTSYQGKEICLNSNGSAFIIADVTDKANPVTISHTTYPNLAYTHQGWLSEDQKYFYMNDELDELNGNVDHTRTLIWDVAELDDPILVKEFLLDSKASDHNLYVRGNFLYESNYQAGLRILDITDPVNPVEVGHFDTVPFGDDVPGFGGSWSNYPYFKSGIIAVSSRGEGLFLVKKQDVDL